MSKDEPRNSAGGLALPFPKPYEPQFPEERGYQEDDGFYQVYAGSWVDWARKQREEQEARGYHKGVLTYLP